MQNMFSGNQEKKIPKNLKDCYKTDNVTSNLWLWCERLEKWGKIFFWVLIVGGLILSISFATADFDFEVFITMLIDTALYAFIEYCAFHIIALLVGALATIVQHTKITADIALYNSAKAEGITDDYDENAEDNIGDEKTKKSKPFENEKLDTLEKWKAEGLITEEEYEEKKADLQRGLNYVKKQ